MSSKTAFIGLGVMGYPMAGHLKKSGHEVTVYNRTASKAEQWVQEFASENLKFVTFESLQGVHN